MSHRSQASSGEPLPGLALCPPTAVSSSTYPACHRSIRGLACDFYPTSGHDRCQSSAVTRGGRSPSLRYHRCYPIQIPNLYPNPRPEPYPERYLECLPTASAPASAIVPPSRTSHTAPIPHHHIKPQYLQSRPRKRYHPYPRRRRTRSPSLGYQYCHNDILQNTPLSTIPPPPRPAFSLVNNSSLRGLPQRLLPGLPQPPAPSYPPNVHRYPLPFWPSFDNPRHIARPGDYWSPRQESLDLPANDWEFERSDSRGSLGPSKFKSRRRRRH